MVDRREVLAWLGVAAAQPLLWTLGCSAPRPAPRRAPQISRDVRTWLHEAVARLAALYPVVHALAVSRRRTTAAIDVLGPGIAHLRRDGVVFAVRRSDGSRREYVTSELTADGIAAAALALGAPRDPAAIEFGPPPATADEPPSLDPADLHDRVARLHETAHRSSRIVYAAALIDIDDAVVWSVAPGRDLEQRRIRIRQSVTRAAWNGSRPVVAAAETAWSGGLEDHPLTPPEIAAASDAALKLMTPGSFDDGERAVVLDPSVAAALLDAATQGPLVTGRADRLGSSLVSLIDDPTIPGAYGGFAFDDEGQPAAPIALVEAGRLVTRLAAGRGRRPGHLGRLEPSSSHLQLRPGTAAIADLQTEGFVLEAAGDATYDPDTDQLRVHCARARELRAGNATGRIYADVELVGSLAQLLGGIDAIARDPTTLALRDDAPDGATRWRSIATPAVRTRGLVRAGRSRP